MTGACRELLEILELHSAVPFSEGVDVVDVTHDLGRSAREFLWAQSPQVVATNDPPMDVSHAGFDKPAKLELLFAL